MTHRFSLAMLLILAGTTTAWALPRPGLLNSDEEFNLSEPALESTKTLTGKPGKKQLGPSSNQEKSPTTPVAKTRTESDVPLNPAIRTGSGQSLPLPTRVQDSRQVSSRRSGAAPPFELRLSDPQAEPFFSGAIPRTESIATDASLNDVCNVGNLAWAVGERGVICFSVDAGSTWTTRITPFECSLKSVCFLTNTVGWVAGCRIPSGSNLQTSAVLLQTRDGGQSWTDLTAGSGRAAMSSDSIPAAALPGIVHIQYFGLDSAIAVTAPMRSRNSHAIFRSDDGGQTWSPISSDQSGGPWLGAQFLSESDGIVVGKHQSYAAVVADHAVVINRPESTLRAIRGVSLDRDASGWIAGDGGFLLTTRDAGVTWKAPAGEIPRSISELTDFHVIAHHGSAILLGGEPGASLIYSPDNGQSWKLITVPLTGRINRLRFLSDTEIIGIGSLGQIIRSSDSGLTWQSVRSAGFRMGVMNLITDADKASWHLLSNASGEMGIRSLAIQLSQPLNLEGNALLDGGAMSDHCNAAVTQLGGNETGSHWMFPRTKPEHHRSLEQLVAEWNRQTDGHLRRLLPLRIARDIRNWRPSVIVIESASDDDAIAAIVRDVMPLAISVASSDQADGIQLSQLGLPPWSVDRIVVRVPESQSAVLAFRDNDLLPSLGTTSGLLHDATQKLFERAMQTTARQHSEWGYELLSDRKNATSIASLFDGLENTLNSDTRRPYTIRSGDQIQVLERILRGAHIESTALSGHMQSAQTEDALIGQLYGIGANLPATLAIKQLHDLAEVNLQQNNMEGYLAVQQEIVRRYPTFDEAQAAAEMLFLFYSSTEARHYRLKAVDSKSQSRQSTEMALQATPIPKPTQPQSPFSVQSKVERATSSPFASGATDAMAALHQRWDLHALTAFGILSNAGHADGTASLSPLIQLRIAANYRLQEKHGEQATVLSQMTQRSDRFGLYARCEMQVTYTPSSPLLPLINLPKRSERPFLDGVLTDTIWEDAEELPLTPFVRDGIDPTTGMQRKSVTQANNVSSLTMLAWDDEFLYLAARFQRAPEKSQPIELVLNRSYDAKHETRDRLELEIDTDRDFGTAFQFTIDESGETSDRCWMLDKWNPKWFVALDADDTTWRVETAIPLKELSASGVKLGDLWNIRLRRIIPGVLQHELQTGTNTVSTDGAGMVRFIRPRNITTSSRK